MAGAAAIAGLSAGVSLGATGAGRDHRDVALQAPSRSIRPQVSASASAAATSAPASATPSASPSATPAPRRSACAASSARHQAPYLIYDSATPEDIPAGHEIATYADGPHPTPPAEVAGRGPVLWIDISGSDPAAQVIDVEPGCATPAAAASWVGQKLTAQPTQLAIVYTTIGQWGQVQADISALPGWMQNRVRWWIADPTGYPHLVPGSQATQWYWGPNYDISTATWQF